MSYRHERRRKNIRQMAAAGYTHDSVWTSAAGTPPPVITPNRAQRLTQKRTPADETDELTHVKSTY